MIMYGRFFLAESQLEYRQQAQVNSGDVPEINCKPSSWLQITGDWYFTTPWHKAAYEGDLAQLQALRASQFNTLALDLLDDQGYTPWMYAAAKGHLIALQYLFEQTVLIANQSERINMALRLAAWNGHLPTAQWLVAQGASLTESDHNGITALLGAAWNGHVPVVQWLVEQGASVTEQDHYGNTALLLAAYEGHVAMVQLLIKQGAPIGEKNQYGTTALLGAAWKGHVPVVLTLIKHGASLADHDNQGNTALLLAIARGHFDMVQVLVAHGASLAATNARGKTALTLAVKKQHSLILDYLLEIGAAMFQSMPFELPIENHRMAGKVVIGLQIKGQPVNRQTLGYEAAITTIEELVAQRNTLAHYRTLIRTCGQYLAVDPQNKPLQQLYKQLLLLSDTGLKYQCLLFVGSNPMLREAALARDSILPTDLKDMIQEIPITVKTSGRLNRV